MWVNEYSSLALYSVIVLIGIIFSLCAFNYLLYRRLMSKSILTKLPKETQAQYVKRKEHDQRFGK